MGTVASLLAKRTKFRLRSVDRIGIGGYVPALQHEGGLVQFLLHRASLRGWRNIPSSALLGHIHDRMQHDLEGFVADHDVPVVRFRRGESKEAIARPYQLEAAAQGRAGVVLIGKAQERVQVWRGWVDKSSPRSTATHPHFCFARQSAVPDHWYFYLWDDEWGPVFIKCCTYAPYGLWVMANGHEWLKRRLTRAGIGFHALDNGLCDTTDPAAARRAAAQLGAGHLQRLIDRWLPTLPGPFTLTDRRAGFWWALSIRQLEIADTAVFDRPAAGRAWFEGAIRDHLDLGRPDNVRIIFARQLKLAGKNTTPGRFHTQVITPGTRVRIEIRYKTSGAKAYLKEGRALRVETTINNPEHFALHKTLNHQNWQALRHVGEQVNSRFLEALGEDAHGFPDTTTFESIVLPTVHNGQRAPGLRFGDPRVMALLASIASFEHVTTGLTNRGLRDHMTDLHQPNYTTRQATYDLRRLRLKGLIERVAGTHTYRVTPLGRQIATFFTRLANRVIIPTLTDLNNATRPPRTAPTPLIAASRAYDNELAKLTDELARAA